mgnify:CR=1 FL=1
MTTETLAALSISLISLIFGIYSSVSANKRSARAEHKRDASELTMVIVKLEDISAGISEIKGDIKDLTERLIVAEQQIKGAKNRLDQIQQFKSHNTRRTNSNERYTT